MTDHPFDDEALRRDDELLDRLGLPRGALSWDDDPVDAPVEPEAALRMLRALREDVGEGLDPAPVVPLRRRRRGPRAIAALAVAGTVLSVGGVAAAAVGAPPGSLLYPIREVVTGHRAPNAGLTAAGRLLDQAEAALAGSRLTAAGALLDDAGRRLAAVRVAGLSATDRATYDGDAARLATLRQQLAGELAAAAGRPGAGQPTAPPTHPGRPSGQPEPAAPSAPHGTPHVSVTPGPHAGPGTSERPIQPKGRVESSSAPSSTPSANPRA